MGWQWQGYWKVLFISVFVKQFHGLQEYPASFCTLPHGVAVLSRYILELL
jgi:hypothetical protein